MDVPQIKLTIPAGWTQISEGPYNPLSKITYYARINTMVGSEDHEHWFDYPPRAYYKFEDGCTISFRAERKVEGVEDVPLEGEET